MPAYRRLREDAEAGRFDVLHCVDVDRLGRDPALSQAVISLVEKSGGEVYSAASPHPVGQRSAGQRYVDAFQMVRAHEEQRIRVRRQRIGMHKRVRRGLFPGVPPTGYRLLRNAQGETVGAEFDEMIGAVRLVTGMFLRGASWSEIKAALDESPYQPPRSRQPTGWKMISIRNLMKNDVYAGRPAWGDAQSEGPSPYYPALWDEDTYQAILRERDRRRTLMPRGNHSPLLGIAICARCGKRMHRSRSNRGDALYLRCGRHAISRRADLDVEPCHPNYIREETCIQAVIDFLGAIPDLDALNEVIVRGAPTGSAETRLQEIEAALSDYGAQRERLGLLVAAGQMQPDIYAATDEQIRAQIDRLYSERTQLARQQVRRTPASVRFRAIDEVRDLLARFERFPAAQINVLLHEGGVRVLVEAGEIVEVGIYEAV